MKTYETRLKGSEEVADGTMAFHFDKPDGFRFKPGQAIDLILDGLPAGDERHTFSIASAPGQDELVVATRMRDSAFKRALRGLAAGAPVKVEGPSGSLTLHGDAARAAVFIAGGIGITPFMSMLRHAAAEPSARQFTLIYSNRRPEDAAFLDELGKLAQSQGNFRLAATMTQPGKSARQWDGARGQIDGARIREVCGGLAAPVYYLAGPPAMVEGMREVLNEAGVSDDDIRSEEFFGY